MIRFIHSNTKFERMLEAMRRSEKMAVAAAKKADAIIENIIENGDLQLSVSGKFSRHGEYRIKNCIKYDIGKGYRMVCVKDDDELFLLFVGSHDDASAWVENNKNFTPDTSRRNMITFPVNQSNEPVEESDMPYEPDYEELLLSRITDKDLKIVFKGLLESPRKSAS